MRWFRRRQRSTPTDPADTEVVDPRTPWPQPDGPEAPDVAAREFWRHWAELLPEISAALGEGKVQRVEHRLCELVAALHPDLQFSIERGVHAVYALVLSSREDPAVRPYTDAWIAAAPQPDAMWEYHDSVPAVPDPSEVTINVGEVRVALADVRVAAHVDADAVDVSVHHPLLGELDGSRRETMTFLPLEATLGERLAARWLRRVEVAVSEPANAMTLLEFRTLVTGLGDTGGPHGDGVGVAD
ncbi:hypothetical protein [Haloechinothrix alba]|nr:hypothetical protein [Haloechinothrix alba]